MKLPKGMGFALYMGVMMPVAIVILFTAGVVGYTIFFAPGWYKLLAVLLWLLVVCEGWFAARALTFF